MESWMLMKKESHEFFELNDYQKACNRYEEALEDIEDKFDKNKPALKVEASKITSNISLMYFKLSQENNDESLLFESKKYANKTIKYNPQWFKGYLRLTEVCKEKNDINDALNAISSYLQDNKGAILDNDFQSLLADIKYYTHKKIMILSPSWHLIRYPDNVCVVDPLGAGHFKTFQEFLYYYGTSVKEISVLIRPGIYIGSYLLTNAEIDIVGDYEVEINDTTNAIDKEPNIVFMNTVSPWLNQEQRYVQNVGIVPDHTFTIDNGKVSMKRISVYEVKFKHPVHAISAIDADLRLLECSVFSKCSASLSCEQKSEVYCKGCRSVGSYGGVITATHSHVKLTDCFISETIGMGIEARDETEQISLKNCTITKCKKQGIVVYNGSKRAKILGCFFSGNCTENTINEGSIQLRSCEALVMKTSVKNQNSNGIVIEGGIGNFYNVKIENCVTGILVQAEVEIKNCNINSCLVAGISICERIKRSIVLENNTIANCLYDIARLENSPKPILKGHKKHEVFTLNNVDEFCKKKLQDRKKSRSKKNRRGPNIGPVGEVLEINEKTNLFLKPASAASCEFCGYSEYQLQKNLKGCEACKVAFYCSPECQKKDWKLHQPHCNSAKEKLSTKEK